MADKLVRLNENVWRRISELAKRDGVSIGKEIEMLIDKPVQTSSYNSSDLADDHSVRWEEPEIPEEFESLAPDELPPCCQRIFDDPENPDVCEHWEKAWVKEFGQRVLGYRNKLTGRTPSDPIYYKYV